MKPPTAVGVALGGLLLTGYNDLASRQASYLRALAQRGVEAHHQLHSPSARSDPDRCSQTFASLRSHHGLPCDDTGTTAAGWHQQLEATFLDSCVSGQPLESLEGGASLG